MTWNPLSLSPSCLSIPGRRSGLWGYCESSELQKIKKGEANQGEASDISGNRGAAGRFHNCAEITLSLSSSGCFLTVHRWAGEGFRKGQVLLRNILSCIANLEAFGEAACCGVEGRFQCIQSQHRFYYRNCITPLMWNSKTKYIYLLLSK